MKPILDRYLDRVLVYADLSPGETASVRQELKDHLLQKIADLRAGGVPAEDVTLEALRQHGSPRDIGYGLRRFRWIDVRCRGTARGFIAIGPRALGVVAFGGMATGVFAFGGVALGIFAMGGLSLGLLLAIGGAVIGTLTYGGLAAGLVACGGLALGAVATGGEAYGAWVVHAGAAHSYYTAANVPAWLQSLVSLIGIPRMVEHYAALFWTVYTVLCVGMGLLQQKEVNRTRAADDWLLESE